MENKLYRLVSVEERLPEKDGLYHTDWGEFQYNAESRKFTECLTHDGVVTYAMETAPNYWFEEIINPQPSS